MEAVDWDQRFKLPRPSRTAPVSPGLVGGVSALRVDTDLTIDGVDVPNFEACPEQSGSETPISFLCESEYSGESLSSYCTEMYDLATYVWINTDCIYCSRICMEHLGEIGVSSIIFQSSV